MDGSKCSGFGSIRCRISAETGGRAISLVGVMGALAVLYLLSGAEFIAAAQVIVYAGAIMVLFVFVIMLLNAGAGTGKRQSIMALFLGVPGVGQRDPRALERAGTGG